MMAAHSVDAASPAGVEARFWPFLISRGRQVGYQVIAAPDFLTSAQLSGLLFDIAGGSPTRPHQARYRLAAHTLVGDFVVMFTVRLADASDLADATTDSPPLDEHSRRIPLIEGVVQRGGHITPDTRDGPLRAGREARGPLFSDFWEADQDWNGTAATAPFLMDPHAGQPVKWERLNPLRSGDSDRPTSTRVADDKSTSPVRARDVSTPANPARTVTEAKPPMPPRSTFGALGEFLRRLLPWAARNRGS